MGFTRSSTNISVHQSLSDYPNQDDNLSATQLKEKFDMPAETLQDDLNGLMTELEAVSSAESIGADVITAGDESDANVQAKLEKIYTDMQNISQGAVADGSITAAKLASSLSDTLAVKDNTLQSGLNAEKLGGDTLATLKAFISGGVVTGTYTGNTTNTTTTQDITLGFQPKALLVSGYQSAGTSPMIYTDDNAIFVFVGTQGKAFVSSGNEIKTKDLTITMIVNGFRLTGKDLNYSSKTYTYVAIR